MYSYENCQGVVGVVTSSLTTRFCMEFTRKRKGWFRQFGICHGNFPFHFNGYLVYHY